MAGVGAMLRGGRVERLGFALFSGGWLLSLGVQLVTPAAWLQLALAPIDLAIMVALIALTWRSPRPWPAAACGFQAIALAAGAAKWLEPTLNPFVHLSLLAAAGYGAVGALAVGAWLHPAPLEQ